MHKNRFLIFVLIDVYTKGLGKKISAFLGSFLTLLKLAMYFLSSPLFFNSLSSGFHYPTPNETC